MPDPAPRPWRPAAVALALLGLGCSAAAHAGDAPASDAPAVGFTSEVLPILRARCVACHLTGQEQGDLALHPGAAYGDLVEVASVQSDLQRVAPGAPERSYLYLKLVDRHLEAGGEGEPMPLGSWPLPPDEVEVIRRWIAEGATDR